MKFFTYSDTVNSICHEVTGAVEKFKMKLNHVYKPWGVIFVLSNEEGEQKRFTFAKENIEADSVFVRRVLDRKIMQFLSGGE